MNVHRVLSVLILCLFLFPIVHSQVKGVDIKPIGGSSSKPSSIQQSTSWLLDHVWMVVIFLAIGMGIFLFLFIWKKTTSQIDPFYMNWKKTKELCKLNKRWSVKSVYRVSGKTGLKWLGDYEGDCILEDSSINILWSNWKWGFWGKLIRWVFFPLRPLLKLVMKDYSICKAPYGEKEVIKIEIVSVGEGKEQFKKIKKTYGDKIVDYVTFDNSGNVLIKSLSLSKSKNFFCPVVRSDKGEVVDTRLQVFDKEQGCALIDGLYNLTVDFANIMRERIAIEPKVRYVQKTEGTEVSET